MTWCARSRAGWRPAVGLVTAAALRLFVAAATDVPRVLIFAVALYLLFARQHRVAILRVVLGVGVVGLAYSEAALVWTGSGAGAPACGELARR